MLGFCRVQEVKCDAEGLTDEQVCQLLVEHLHIDARPSFAAAALPIPMKQRCGSEAHKVGASYYMSVALPIEVTPLPCTYTRSRDRRPSCNTPLTVLCVHGCRAVIQKADSDLVVEMHLTTTAISVSVSSSQVHYHYLRWRRMLR